MFKNTFFVTLSLVASAALGFLSQLLVAAKFGVSEEMDLHFSIVSFPSIVTGTSSVIFTSVFIPFFSKFKSNINEYTEYIKDIGLIIFVAGLLFMVVSVIISVSYIGGQSEEIKTGRRQLICYVSLFISIGAGCSLMSGYMSAILNYERRFLKVAWTSVLPALLIIICVILLDAKLGVLSISLGYAMGFFLQFIVLLNACKLNLRLDKINVKKIVDKIELLKQSIFVFLALLPFTITAPIAYYWAADIEVGSISYIGYSLAFSGFLSVVVSMGISTVTFPDLADNFVNDKEKSSLPHFQQTLFYVLILAMFLAGMLITLRVEIITFIYLQESFNSELVENLSILIKWFFLSAVFISGLNLLRTLLFARSENLKLAILGLAFSITYFVIAGILKEIFSISGIGIANLVCYTLLFAMTAHMARNKNLTFLGLRLYGLIVKSALTVSITCLITYFFLKILNVYFTSIISILISVLLYSFVYFIVAKFVTNLRDAEILIKTVYIQLKSLRNFI
jgi:putative peptidoglycan lipid II flippase